MRTPDTLLDGPAQLDTRQVLATADDIAGFCARNAASIDYEGAFPADEFARIADSGLLAAPVAGQYGGMGLGVAGKGHRLLLQVLKRVGYGNLSVGRLYEGHVNAIQLIQTFGDQDQQARYASDVIHHQAIFGVWNTEMSDGLQLLPDGDRRFRMEGAKSFASGAGHIQRPLVTGALPDGGWQMLVVAADEVAVVVDESWWQPIGMRASATFKIDLTGIVVDRGAFIGAPGDYHLQPWFTGGAIRFAAVQFGGALALLDETRAVLSKAGRDGDPYQRARIADGVIAAQSGELWLQRAGDMLDAMDTARTPEHVEQITVFANMTRTIIERIASQIVQIAQQSAGARGMLRPHPIERIIRDLTMYLRQPAPDAAVQNVGEYALSREECAGDLWATVDDE